MLKLLLIVLAETIVGVTISGVLLAMAIPVLRHYGLIASNDLVVAALITLTMVVAVGTMILRPGSAMNRHFRR